MVIIFYTFITWNFHQGCYKIHQIYIVFINSLRIKARELCLVIKVVIHLPFVLTFKNLNASFLMSLREIRIWHSTSLILHILLITFLLEASWWKNFVFLPSPLNQNPYILSIHSSSWVIRMLFFF